VILMQSKITQSVRSEIAIPKLFCMFGGKNSAKQFTYKY